ncbi:RNA-binding S4 domain-containing protein [Pseudooceanicola sp. 216_PA32_1]|uniref:RNA-binding S4 domain-containing protein n=1 Tax=Pseudooceanicola pacificus TaxID=2676438 RepID=A0A844WDI7_9RHOB|nr:RNA-binding S4 domain-containing protein [Pseudooceanicola pacificus]
MRVDKWLWHARFLKSRSLATALVAGGHLRINGTRAAKPAHTVVPGDVLTFPQGDRIRVVRILAVGIRRGPAPEAQALYADLDQGEKPAEDLPGIARIEGNSRPTKKDRRKLDLDRLRALE